MQSVINLNSGREGFISLSAPLLLHRLRESQWLISDFMASELLFSNHECYFEGFWTSVVLFPSTLYTHYSEWVLEWVFIQLWLQQPWLQTLNIQPDDTLKTHSSFMSENRPYACIYFETGSPFEQRCLCICWHVYMVAGVSGGLNGGLGPLVVDFHVAVSPHCGY